MNPGYGITSKMLIWFLIVVSMFYATILVLYVHIQQAVQISGSITNKNYTISSSSRKMTENLLAMEENEKKYRLLKKKDYLQFFSAAQTTFEENLVEILQLRSKGVIISKEWDDIYEAYRQFPSAAEMNLKVERAESDETLLAGFGIPEKLIDELIVKISSARLQNEKEMLQSTQELNRRGRISAQQGMIGLGITSVVGLIGIIFLAYSMIRPLKELINGIRSISKDRHSNPIQVRSKDEFGELAAAFNDMTARLKQEEQMRSDFISMLSHEIRTPLTSIRESVSMISEEVMGPVNKRQHKFLEIAGSEIDRICDLLNHLMQASRLEPGALKVRGRRLDTYALVSTCIESLKPAAEVKNVTIKHDIPTDLPNAFGDKKQIQQVLLNLIGNAVKFSELNGEIIVRVTADDEMNSLIFTIMDSGPGILEEELDLLFNKYYRGQNVRDHMDGTGLGLSIAKNIVEAHNGTIWVSSQVGKGSVFGFSLPKTERLLQ